MKRTTSHIFMLLAATALVVLAGCSGGNKKNTNNAKSANTAATIAATVARTPTPIPTVARTATPAPTAARVATAVAAGVRTPTPAAGDLTLQQALAAAALKDSDLPGGYLPMGSADTTLSIPGQTAAYLRVYLNTARIPDLGLVIDDLLGFRDVASAQAGFANLQTELQASEQDFGLKLTPAPVTTRLGDDTQVFTATLSVQGFTFNGYLVAWRRGRLIGGVFQAGSGGLAPASAGDVYTLAQKQDGYLQAVKQ